MKTIGITGNIGSGKSMVEKRMSELLNVPAIDTDAVAKQIAENNLDLVKKFSARCIEEDKINYDILFTDVFSDEEKIRRINRLFHPLVEEEIGRMINDFSGKKFPAVVISSALFFEAQIKTDYLILVDCPEDIRLQRVLKKLMEREKDFESARNIYRRAQRLNELQFSSEKMRYYCDWIIDNNGSPEEMEEQIHKITGILRVKIMQGLPCIKPHQTKRRKRL